MIAAWVFVMALLGHGEECRSTIFGMPGDGYGGRLPTVYYKRPVDPTKDVGIAHRTLRMGKRIKVTNLRTGRWAWARVIDRGPYGMMDEQGWFNSRKKPKRAARWIKLKGREAYLGCADLTPRLGRLIGHNFGRDRVRISW